MSKSRPRRRAVETAARPVVESLESRQMLSVSQVLEINSTGSSNPSSITPFGDGVIFVANDGTSTGRHGTEPWISDGTAAGTFMLKDIVAGTGSSMPALLTPVGDKVFFVATDSAGGRELWMSDGTASGTVRVKDIVAGSGSSNPSDLTNVADINPGSGSSNPANFTAAGYSGNVFFSATDGTHGQELWIATPINNAPTHLAAALVAQATATLNWQPSPDYTGGYAVERSTDGTNFTTIGTADDGVTTYDVTGLTANTSYTFRIRATGDASSDVATLSIHTLATGVPIAPSNVQAVTGVQANDWSHADIYWIDNSSLGSVAATSFTVQRRTTGDTSWTTIATVAASETSYTDNTVTSATDYEYRILANAAAGSSGTDDNNNGNGTGTIAEGDYDIESSDDASTLSEESMSLASNSSESLNISEENSSPSDPTGNTGSDNAGNHAIASTPVAYGDVFQHDSGTEWLFNRYTRTWTGGVNTTYGDLDHGTTGNAATLHLTNLPKHGALAFSMFGSGDLANYNFKLDGTTINPADADAGGVIFLQHNATSGNIEVTPNYTPGAGTWTPPTFKMQMDTPQLNLDGANMTVGDQTQVSLSAYDHSERTMPAGTHTLPWKFALSLAMRILRGTAVNIQTTGSIAAGVGETLIELGAEAAGVALVEATMPAIGAISPATTQVVGVHSIDIDDPIVIYRGQSSAIYQAVVTKADNSTPATGATVDGNAVISGGVIDEDGWVDLDFSAYATSMPSGKYSETIEVVGDPGSKKTVHVTVKDVKVEVEGGGFLSASNKPSQPKSEPLEVYTFDGDTRREISGIEVNVAVTHKNGDNKFTLLPAATSVITTDRTSPPATVTVTAGGAGTGNDQDVFLVIFSLATLNPLRSDVRVTVVP